MNFIKGLLLASVFALSFAGDCLSSEFVEKITAALDEKKYELYEKLVEGNLEAIPAEIQELLEEVLSTTVSNEDRELKFALAERIATSYKDATGDTQPLITVKKVSFNSKLGEPVKSKKKGGVHIVDMPQVTEGIANIFEPDNIVISAGETVRWVNESSVDHIFASMTVIGAGGIFSPTISSEGKWEYTFDLPGEYYYLCFIHRGMIGKVTVEIVE